jgi:hypothetical protein
MRGSSSVVTASLFALASIGCSGGASAFPRTSSPVPSVIYQTVATFQGPIPTEANPIRDTQRLMKMRRQGKLPDTFVRGRCKYNIAGDSGATYYVKSCR